jgi:hypothetical protein
VLGLLLLKGNSMDASCTLAGGRHTRAAGATAALTHSHVHCKTLHAPRHEKHYCRMRALNMCSTALT